MTGGVVAEGEDDDVSASRELEEELGVPGLELKMLEAIPYDHIWMNLYSIKCDGPFKL